MLLLCILPQFLSSILVVSLVLIVPLMKGRNLSNFHGGCKCQLMTPPSPNLFREGNWGNPSFHLKYREFPACRKAALENIAWSTKPSISWNKNSLMVFGPPSPNSWLFYPARWQCAVLRSVRDTGPKLGPSVPVLSLHATLESSHIILAIFLMNLAWEKYEH